LKPLGTSTFHEKNGNPFCENCHSGIFLDRCGGCNQPISGESVEACGKKWHQGHFACAHCKKVFTAGVPFFENNGNPYCELHYNMNLGRICACGCGTIINGPVTSALGRNWIPNHFVCNFCMNPLQGNRFVEQDKKPYCHVCHSKIYGTGSNQPK